MHCEHIYDLNIFIHEIYFIIDIKILRFIHIYSVLQSLRYLVDELGEIFYLHRYMFVNLLSWTCAGLKFMLSVHYLSCGWIYIEIAKAEKGLPRVEFSSDTDFAIYVDSFYLMTTTISKVGYGDFKGFIGVTGDYEQEMLYLYFVTLYGTTLFSSVLSEIFSYKKLLSIINRIIVHKEYS